MKMILFPIFLSVACLEPLPPWPVEVARDDDPGYCSHEYPFDEPPTMCESNSSGDCCSWEFEHDGGTCRYDYCSSFNDPTCSWDLQYKSCE